MRKVHRPRLLLAAILVAITIARLASGEDAVPKVEKTLPDPASLRYLSPDAVDFAKLLPAPPKPDSDEAKADLEVVLRVQETRTEEQIQRALAEAKLKMGAFSPIIGSWFTAENLPLTAKLLEGVEKDSKFFSASSKQYFARKRPPKDARIKPKIDEKDEPSYPSGHATRGILFATILCEFDTSQKDALMDRAREIGWDRVIAGVHYPSDLIAGRVLGQALAQAMDKNAKFQEDLAAAKAEFKAARAHFSEAIPAAATPAQ